MRPVAAQTTSGLSPDAHERAAQSGGQSNSSAIYAVARELLERRHATKGVLMDVGCGAGGLFDSLAGCFSRYVGVDGVEYPKLPPGLEFQPCNLDVSDPKLPVIRADAVVCLEVIEHVENPRALFRALLGVLKPGGTIVVSTPNQLSWLSKLCLVVKGEFVHFQERPGLYPSHLSALVETDLRRLAKENHLDDVEVVFSADGRMPGTALHWPHWLPAKTGWRGRAFSDNVFLVATKPR